MNDFLATLAMQTLGMEPLTHPLVPVRYAPMPPIGGVGAFEGLRTGMRPGVGQPDAPAPNLDHLDAPPLLIEPGTDDAGYAPFSYLQLQQIDGWEATTAKPEIEPSFAAADNPVTRDAEPAEAASNHAVGPASIPADSPSVRKYATLNSKPSAALPAAEPPQITIHAPYMADPPADLASPTVTGHTSDLATPLTSDAEVVAPLPTTARPQIAIRTPEPIALLAAQVASPTNARPRRAVAQAVASPVAGRSQPRQTVGTPSSGNDSLLIAPAPPTATTTPAADRRSAIAPSQTPPAAPDVSPDSLPFSNSQPPRVDEFRLAAASGPITDKAPPPETASNVSAAISVIASTAPSGEFSRQAENDRQGFHAHHKAVAPSHAASTPYAHMADPPADLASPTVTGHTSDLATPLTSDAEIVAPLPTTARPQIAIRTPEPIALLAAQVASPTNTRPRRAVAQAVASPVAGRSQPRQTVGTPSSGNDSLLIAPAPPTATTTPAADRRSAIAPSQTPPAEHGREGIVVPPPATRAAETDRPDALSRPQPAQPAQAAPLIAATATAIIRHPVAVRGGMLPAEIVRSERYVNTFTVPSQEIMHKPALDAPLSAETPDQAVTDAPDRTSGQPAPPAAGHRAPLSWPPARQKPNPTQSAQADVATSRRRPADKPAVVRPILSAADDQADGHQNSAPSATPQREPTPLPTIRVTIGRIEVRNSTPALPTATGLPGRPRPALSLDDYLKRPTKVGP